MSVNVENKIYSPGMYTKKRIEASVLADQYLKQLDKINAKKQNMLQKPPVICFSRKIGVGALEIADILSEMIGFRVIDRELVEFIATKANLSERTVAIFDEKYPGYMSELLNMAFGEKSFIKSDYSRLLFRAFIAMTGIEPAIIVGRGAHLVIDRERVLAVRFICSMEKRIQYLANILNEPKQQIEKNIDQLDKEQRAFFKEVYGKKDASPYEFDIVINCDYITEPKCAAAIVAAALEAKYGDKIKKYINKR